MYLDKQYQHLDWFHKKQQNFHILEGIARYHCILCCLEVWAELLHQNVHF